MDVEDLRKASHALSELGDGAYGLDKVTEEILDDLHDFLGYAAEELDNFADKIDECRDRYDEVHRTVYCVKHRLPSGGIDDITKTVVEHLNDVAGVIGFTNINDAKMSLSFYLMGTSFVRPDDAIEEGEKDPLKYLKDKRRIFAELTSKGSVEINGNVYYVTEKVVNLDEVDYDDMLYNGGTFVYAGDI